MPMPDDDVALQVGDVEVVFVPLPPEGTTPASLGIFIRGPVEGEELAFYRDPQPLGASNRDELVRKGLKRLAWLGTQVDLELRGEPFEHTLASDVMKGWAFLNGGEIEDAIEALPDRDIGL
jgi:hypothetical protein